MNNVKLPHNSSPSEHSTLFDLLQLITRGYRLLGRRVALTLLTLLFTAATGVVIVWPLWYVATTARSVYTAVVVAAFALLVATAIYRKVQSRRAPSRQPRPAKGSTRPTHLPIVKKAAIVAAALGGVYGIALLFAVGLIALAVPALILGLATLGYISGLYGDRQ